MDARLGLSAFSAFSARLSQAVRQLGSESVDEHLLYLGAPRHTDLCIATKEGAMPSEIVKPSAFVVLKLTTSYELFRPSVSYPIAIRLRRSRREATSMRYVTSANTAHPPWNSTPAATTRPPGIGPMAARSQRSARVVSGIG
jgi:hypothetical protein